jgi:hypothetical protein
VLSFAAAAAAALGATAQQQIMQDGRLFDANNQLGNPYNFTRPVSPMIGGNAFATGNVRGLSLRSRSPITDPTAFHANLGSSSLYTFRRDSVAVGDIYGGQYLGSPYYDPSTTAATGSYLRRLTIGPTGVERPVTPGLVSGLTDYRLNTRAEFLQQNDTRLPPAPVGPATLGSSSIFGPGAVGVIPPAEQLSQDLESRRDALSPQPTLSQPRMDVTTPDLSALGARPAAGTPLDLIMQGGPLARPVESVVGPTTGALESAVSPDRSARVPGPLPPPRPAESAAADRSTPRIVDESILPGADVFNDMQMALSLQKDPRAAWFQEMLAAAKSESAPSATPAQEKGAQAAEEFVSSMLNAPIRSFAGQSVSRVNEMMLKAEALMQIGRYREAADRYEDAHRADVAALGQRRTNPLPLLGKANALLAAGSYGPAVEALLRALEYGPEIARFNFDLPALLGGIEMIDKRRADLESRLADRDDVRLRFLLGYLEYYGGYRELGLANLERAAREGKSGSIIARFPAMLRGEALPLPKLGTVPPEPARSAPPREPSEKHDE